MHEGRDANRDRLLRECQDAQNAVISMSFLKVSPREKKKQRQEFLFLAHQVCVFDISVQETTNLFSFFFLPFFSFFLSPLIIFSYPKYGITSMKLKRAIKNQNIILDIHIKDKRGRIK